MMDDYVEVEFIKLENGLEYAIVDELVIDGNMYLYMVNEERKDVEIRKQDENDYLIKIDKKEYDKVMLEFMKKHRNDFRE